MTVLLTGGTGFVGSAVSKLLAQRHNVVIAGGGDSAQSATSFATAVKTERLPGLGGWRSALEGCSALVHLAGRAHVMRESSEHPLTDFRRVNVEGTLGLARLALDAGVKRFVFVSSIGVNGNYTTESSLNETSPATPHADYAISKWEAEQGLWNVVRGSAMELVIVRPPLVYASHAPGNFGRLLKLVASGVPLPLAAVRNKRSMVALENLTDFLALCVEHPAAANELFVISDGQEVSTPEIIRHLARGMGRPSRLFHVPTQCLRFGAQLLGKKGMYSQLCDSLVVDSSKAKELLGWSSSVSTHAALEAAGRGFVSSRAYRMES